MNKTSLDLNIKTDPPAQFKCLSSHKAITQALLDEDPTGMYSESQSGPLLNLDMGLYVQMATHHLVSNLQLLNMRRQIQRMDPNNTVHQVGGTSTCKSL